MTVFSDADIVQGLIDGSVICRPLRVENIKSSSIDLTLGEWFWRCDANAGGVFNPYDEAEVKRYFAGPFQAKPYASVYEKIGWAEPNWPYPAGRDKLSGAAWRGDSPHPFKGIPEDWPVIVIRPRERLLGHSHEFVGVTSKAPGTSMLKARSSTGRIGMKVCDDAGWGDINFIYRWTWEMRNDNDEAVILPVGERMAQLVLLRTGPVVASYGVGQDYDGKYQRRGKPIDELIAGWKPEDMLPRAYRDQRQPLLPLDRDLYEQTIEELRSQR